MQVFKLYWKLLRANVRSFFIYFGIFSGLLFGVIIPNQAGNEKTDYAGKKVNFAVCDEDGSESSMRITEYLSEIHNQKNMKSFDGDVIQDELFYREVDAVLVFRKGFEDALKKSTKSPAGKNADEESGNLAEYAEITVIPETMNGALFEQAYNGYVSKLAIYLHAGYSVKDALLKTDEACAMEMPVQFSEGQNKVGHTPEYSFYVYLVWIFIAVCIQSVAPVLGIMDRKEVKNRVYFSAYRFSAFNLEILLATIVTGLMICGFFQILATIILGVNPASLQGILWILNMICFMIVAMAFTLLASRITSQGQILSAISNIISLGMAFLCGVFVPMEFLGEGVLKAARFLPAYWYVQAVDLIGSNNTANQLGTIFACMGIELLFGGAIIAIAFLIAKRKA